LKKFIFVMLFPVVLFAACGGSEETTDDVITEEAAPNEKRSEMLDSAVMLYMNQMTMNYSNAFTTSATKEDKMEYLNEAITDINLTVYEIEDEYKEGVPPTDELFQLADHLLDSIDFEMMGEGEEAGNSARDAGVIIGDLSREYLDGELPVGVKMMTGMEDAK